MKNIFILNLLVLVIIFVFTTKCYAELTFSKCDENQLKGTVNWINVSNCDPALVDRCSFKRGTDVTITTSFTSHESTNGLKVKIYGTVLGLSVPWRINPDDACAHGVVCPIAANAENVFTLSMPISKAYPPIPVVVKLRLEDSRKKPHFCITFPAKIED